MSICKWPGTWNEKVLCGDKDRNWEFDPLEYM